MLYRKMLGRCLNQNDPSYHRYGGRGIEICQEWLGTTGFERFLADMGRRPDPALTIERKNNGLGYCASNCTWADRTRQANNRRTNRMVAYNGQIMTLADAARAAGLPYGTVVRRVNAMRWSEHRALTQPVRGR